MNSGRLYSVLFEPHVTEKVTNVGESSNQYGFKVSLDATKREIKTAVETLFGVTVEDVTTVKVKGKAKRRRTRSGRTTIRSKDWKKAYVRLNSGDSIDFSQEIR